MGHVEEVKDYFEWCLNRCYLEDPAEIQPLYGLHGELQLEEEILDHLSGYRDSKPVRIGNKAKDQLQIDVYGELILGIYETTLYGGGLTDHDWEVMRNIIDYVCDVWQEPDAGIWEVRSEPQHFVYSKVMCWAALDRGLKIVDDTDFEGPTERWKDSRNAIRTAILDQGYSEQVNSFVRSFEAENTLDATSLLIPIVGFLPFEDQRVQGTIDATLNRLATDDGLVDRYEGEDGLPGEEGAFILCSFWLVDALALSGRLEEATEVFQNVIEYISPIGLLAEEIHPKTKQQLGNFPQAFSHIGLINSALYLGKTRGQDQAGPEPLGTKQSPND